MTRDALKQVVLDTLTDLAPEVDPASIQEAVRLRDQLDLDSMDWLRFFAALEQKLGVTVPDTDCAKLVTLSDVLAYLAARKG